MIRISNLNKYYNKNKSNAIHVINDISLELPDTGMVAIFGRSGCGKTTLLNVIGGLDKFSDGSVEIDGNSIRKDTDTLRNKEIGYIFQNYNLNNKINCFENVASALKLCGLDDKEEIEKRVLAALDNVDMSKYRLRLPNTLSGGQMQRIAIARAIVKNPKIILADEPTGNLDEHNTIMIMDLLKEISKTHLVILVTHEANLVNLYCDKIIALSDGKIINERDNAIENSYVARDKNHIFLGELEKREDKTNYIDLEYFGKELNEPLDLRVVNYNGKIYLKINTPKVQVLDDASEVKLVEGVFQTEGVKKEKELKMKDIPSFEGTRYGRLFNFKDSIRDGFRENFKKKKIGNILLKIALGLFAFIIVMMTARFGVSIKNIIDNEDNYNKNVFFVYTPDAQHSKILEDAKASDDTGIEFTRLTNYTDVYSNVGLTKMKFDVGQFESYQTDTGYSSGIQVSFMKLSKDLIGDKRLLAGRKIDIQNGEVVITSKLADKLIEQADLGYVKKYRDLIGFTASNGSSFGYLMDYYFSTNNNVYRVVGVVEGSESEMFMTDLDLVDGLFDDYNGNMNVGLASKYGFELSSNETYYLTYDPLSMNTGTVVKINGKNYTVTKVVNASDYDYYYKEIFLINDEDYSNLYKYFDESDEIVRPSYGGFYNSYYTAVYSSDIEKTEQFLKDKFSDVTINDGEVYGDYRVIYTPQAMREKAYESSHKSIRSNLITLAVIIALLSVCMYFIMHAMVISRIKEIGIYRAIGVTKKNLIFKFWIEALVLTTLTVFIGYLIASGLLVLWSIKASLLKDILYYPGWMALIVVVFLYAVSSLCGLIPVFMLLRRTPSSILSKYDI